MDIDALKERLAKMKALADCGIGGERTAADHLIREICAKYGLFQIAASIFLLCSSIESIRDKESK